MQVRYVIANVTEAEERIVISPEEGEEPPPAHVIQQLQDEKPQKITLGRKRRRQISSSKALLSSAQPGALRGYGHTTNSNFIHTVPSLTGNLRVLIAKHCFCLIIVTWSEFQIVPQQQLVIKSISRR